MMQQYFLILLPLIVLTNCVNHDIIRPYLCDRTDLKLLVDSTHEATSCSIQDGFIRVMAQGGQEPYFFSINEKARQPASSFSDLAAGSYAISVKDGNGCEFFLPNISITAKDLQFSAAVQKDNQCIDHNGVITISITDGNAPFTFKLDDQIFSEANSFSDLKHGTHIVIVRDNNGCTIQLNIDVPRDTTGISWTNDILPIMKTSCALNGCHDGKTRFDYRDYQNAKKDKLSIKTKTQDMSMPFDGTIPQDQIDKIACWVDDGAPEN